MALAFASCCLSWSNHIPGAPTLSPIKPVGFAISSRLWPKASRLSPKSAPSNAVLSQGSAVTKLHSWSEFARHVSGEWDGFGAEFSSKGQPLELPESVVPEAYREWEVQVFDWQTQCPTLAQPDIPTMTYKSIKLLPTVGCEADAATRYSIDERIIGAADDDSQISAFAYSLAGSYAAVWPKGDNKPLEVEHCLMNPKDKQSRVRIYQVVQLAETKMDLLSIKVFCEQWDGPFRNGDQLGGCAIREFGFASTPTTKASSVLGTWKGLHAAAHFDAAECDRIQQITGEKAVKSEREESDLILLPRGLWCSFKESKDGDIKCETGWLFEQGHTITSRCIFSSEYELKEISIGKETAESDT